MSIRELFSSWIYPREILLAEQFNYGHREVLIATNDLPNSTLFLASIIHGWGLEDNPFGIAKIRARNFQCYPIYAWSHRSANIIRNSTGCEVSVIGSPWSHLLQSLGINSEEKVQAASTSHRVLYFAPHSMPGGTSRHTDMALDAIFKKSATDEITVCLFWLDFIDPEIRKHYSKNKVKIECVGFRGSSGFETPWTPIGGRVSFLPKLFELISSHDLIVVDSVSTPFWYALSLGKNVMIPVENHEVKWWGGEAPRAILDTPNSVILKSISPSLSKFPIGEIVTPDSGLKEIALLERGWYETENLMKIYSSKKMTHQDPRFEKLVEPIINYVKEQTIISS